MVTLNILVSIDLVFYLILIIAILMGFLRGFKKSIYNLIVMAVFYIVFFLTLTQVVNGLWGMNLSFLGNVLSNIDPSLANFTSFSTHYEEVIQALFNNSLDMSNAEVNLLAEGLIKFGLKIIWAILYFTIILLIYKIITGIIRGLFVKSKGNKHRGMGAVVGVLNGAMAVFVTLIVLGGSVSFLENITMLASDTENIDTTSELTLTERTTVFDVTQSIIYQGNIIELAEEEPVISQDVLDTTEELVTNYNNNLIVKIANGIKVTSSYNEETQVPLHINLFDQILSFDYDGTNISIRNEVSVFSNAYKVILDSEFSETNQITDIKGEEIREAFSHLESSTLLPTLLPIAIKYYSNENDINLSISDDDLYDYDYQTEISRLGNIISGVFDLLNESDTSIDENGQEVTVDGDFVKDIFQDVANSRVVLLTTEAFLVPAIQEGEGTLSQIIEIEDGFTWDTEYLALGDILAEMVDAGVSISTIETADASQLLGMFSKVDSTVLLDSKIITNALINILSGEAEIEGIEFLSVPTNITWESTDTTTGELEYILLAIQAILLEQDDLDFAQFDVDLINTLPSTTIDTILDSYIIRATITDQIATLDLGDFNLTVPDDALDLQDYYTKEELSALISSIKLIYDDLETFDLDTLFNMDESEYQTLFESTIIRSTITSQLLTFDLGQDSLVIPNDVYETTDYITSEELIDLMLAIKIIYDDLDTFDLDTLFNMAESEYQTLFESIIIRSTITAQLLTFNLGQDSLVIPNDVYETTDYITSDELIDLMLAIKIIYDDIDTFDIDVLYNLNSTAYDTLFTSKIIRATITNTLESFNLGAFGLVIPDNTYETEDYLTKVELVNLMNGISMISSDVDTFTIDSLFALDQSELSDLFGSTIMQATISDIILGYSMSTQDTSQMKLIVPNVFRENITVDTITEEQIEANELIDIILAINAIGITGFDGGINPDLISSSLDFDLILNSGSMHVTFDNIIDSNDDLVVPDLATDILYGINDIIIETELINLIEAVDAFSTSADIADVTFDFNTITTLSPNDQNIILDSMVVRNIITPDIETAVGIDPMYTLDSSDYVEGNISLFLTKQGVIDYINYLNSL
ncbi:MAG: CvpA family protein [Candidatus Izimaplasma sp.]|nr:CvpA family protein [Candidatus Izimaplasma bacterium]